MSTRSRKECNDKDIHDNGRNKHERIEEKVAKLNLKPVKPRKHPIED